MGSRSPKSNQHFSPSQRYICVSLAKICPFNKETECGQEATPTPPPQPTGSALKTICPPPPHMVGRQNEDKSNKRTKSIKISSLFPKRGNRNAKRTEKHKNKMIQGKTQNKSPRRINNKATKSKTNTWTTALERSVE